MSDNKIALVTGASRGIGLAIAKTLSQSGYRIIGTATSDKNVQAMQDLFKSSGIQGVCFPLNLADVNAPKALMQSIEGHFQDTPSVLVNNAGVTQDGLLMRMRDAQWDDVQSINLGGCFRMIKTFARPMMRKKWGRIINLSSVVAFTGNVGQANYVSAKAGVIGLTKSAALELAGSGITVNAIAPGFIATDMTATLNDVQQQAILKKIPLQRMGQADEIASTVLFLCSNGYVTGQSLHVNGGLHLD